MSTGPRPWSPWLRKRWLPNWKKPLSTTISFGPRTPVFNAAIAMKGLNVDPGGYVPRRARFSSGLSIDSFSSFQLSASMPSTKRLGSNVGLLTNASTSPLRGSIATSAPRRSPNICSTSDCSLMSTDNISVLPGVAAWLFRRRTARPPALVSTSSNPVAPCSSLS